MMMNSEMWVSFFSVILYGFIACFSADQFLKYHTNKACTKIRECRKLFFGILSISATLDLPVWFLCIGYLGPSTCVMETVAYKIFLCFHHLALCGYAFTLGITTILWSDILTDNEEKPILDFKNPSTDRKFFYGFFLLYFLNALTVILSICFWMDSNDPNHFLEYNQVYQFSDFTEPFLICCLAGGCLFTGVRLQKYVVSVRLGTRLQREFLLHLNIVLFLVTTCYLARAIFVFTMVYDFGSEDLSGISFGVWTLCTRWLPNVGSSLCLFVFMCRSQSNSTKAVYDNELSQSQSQSWAEPLLKQEESYVSSDHNDFNNDDTPLSPSKPDLSDKITEDENITSPSPIFRYENVSRSFSEPDTDYHTRGTDLRFPNILMDTDKY